MKKGKTRLVDHLPALILTAGLYSHQLQIDTLDRQIRVLHHQLASQRLADHAVGGIQMTFNEEFRRGTPLGTRRNGFLKKMNISPNMKQLVSL